MWCSPIEDLSGKEVRVRRRWEDLTDQISRDDFNNLSVVDFLKKIEIIRNGT